MIINRKNKANTQILVYYTYSQYFNRTGKNYNLQTKFNRVLSIKTPNVQIVIFVAAQGIRCNNAVKGKTAGEQKWSIC